jgi:spore coat protein CotF
MPFGARETLETHEMLNELKIGIEHLAYYARHCADQGIKSVLEHQTTMMMSTYDRLLSYTHDYNAAEGRPAPYERPNVSPQDIQYGLRQPTEQQIQVGGGGGFPSAQLGAYAIVIHKNSARNLMNAALECADPNVRDILLNGAASCANQAYELFIVLNRQGDYQIPTMRDHTAKTYLHLYRPTETQQNDGSHRPMMYTPADYSARDQDFSHRL